LTAQFPLDKLAALSGMATSPAGNEAMPGAARSPAPWKAEGLGILALAAMLVYFLALSWRRWPDPLVDFGQQCYDIWRLSQGAALYHDFVWSYGPISICFNACLFLCFGPGIMVLVMANLVIYGLILALAYLAFRMAWGWAGAFAATADFICVFSFSHLLGVGNYNYATPYSAESVHGMLLILAAAFIVARWCRGASLRLAFLLGLCGGVAAVMKPEFMLALGVLGMAALALRYWQRRFVTMGEFALLFAGAILPTLAFTAWFARMESFAQAFVDASAAWWLVVVQQMQRESGQQMNFSGLDHPLRNAATELTATGWALLVMAAVWAAGWLVNRPWLRLMRIVTAVAACVLAGFVRLPGGWFSVGRCLPGLVFLAFIVVWLRVCREKREQGRLGDNTIMALALVLLAGAMLARMVLFARIFHMGFFQAALAAMVVAAMMVADLPRWTGTGIPGRRVTALGCFLVLLLGCGFIAAKSRAIRLDQTEPVGWGRDRFYATTRTIDGTGALVNWAADRLRSAPPDATALVLPEGAMINYLARRRSLEPGWIRGGTETDLLRQMRLTPPDYIVLITRDLTEFGVTRFGAPGNTGYEIVKWAASNYSVDAHLGGDPLAINDHPGAIILKHKTK
jgi:hypothetical protein